MASSSTLGTITVELAPGDIDRIAEAVAAKLSAPTASTGWLGTKDAADYAGCTVNSLNKAVSADEVQFSQTCEGGKRWFRREWIDTWRGL